MKKGSNTYPYNNLDLSNTENLPELATYIMSLTEKVRLKEVELNNMKQSITIIDKIKSTFKMDTPKMNPKCENTTIADEIDALIVPLTDKNKYSDDDITAEKLKEKLLDLEISLTATSLQHEHILAQNIVKSHMIAGMSLGLLPAPLFDVAILSGTQASLLRCLSNHYNVEFSSKKSKVAINALLSGSLPVLTMVGLSSFVKVIPGIGTFGGAIGMTTLAGAMVYATGQVFISHFENGGTLDDFDAKHWNAYFKQHLNEAKVNIKENKKESK